MKFLFVIACLLAFTNAQRIDCLNILGELPSEFAAFFFGNYTLLSSDNEGAIAVGQNAILHGSGIGFGLKRKCQEAGTGPVSAVIGNSIKMNEGRIFNGDLVYGNNVTSTIGRKVKLDKNCDETVDSGYLDFGYWESYLKNVSRDLAATASTGMTKVTTSNSKVKFYGNAVNRTQYFDVKAQDILATKYFSLNVSKLTTDNIVINVRGTVGGFGKAGGVAFNAFKNYQGNLIWNFYEATTMEISGVGIIGTVLAPLADFMNPKGEIYGQIIGRNWNGRLQQHNVPLCFVAPPPPPPQTTGSTGTTRAATTGTTLLATTGTTGTCCCADFQDQGDPIPACCSFNGVGTPDTCAIPTNSGLPCCNCCGQSNQGGDSGSNSKGNVITNNPGVSIPLIVVGVILFVAAIIGAFFIVKKMKSGKQYQQI